MSDAYQWYKIADTLEEIHFSGEGLAEITTAGKHFCIVNKEDILYACSATCPHAGGALAEGYTDAACNIVCPVHCYKFSLQTGQNTSGEGYFLKTHPIEQRHDGIFIGIKPIPTGTPSKK